MQLFLKSRSLIDLRRLLAGNDGAVVSDECLGVDGAQLSS